jgi:hypothetical protein
MRACRFSAAHAIRRTALGVLPCLAVLPTAAPQAATLQPGGEWQVEQADESCRLWRDFGSGAEQVRFNIYAYGPDESFRVVLTGPQIPRANGRAQEGELTFNGGEATSIILVTSQSGGDGMTSFLMDGRAAIQKFIRGYDVPGPFVFDRVVATAPDHLRQLTVSSERMAPLTLELGETAQPLADLLSCQRRLAESWGVPASAMTAGATRPWLEPFRETFMRLSMPEGMVLNHITIVAQMRVMVDADGTPQSCVVQSPPIDRRQQRGLCNPLMQGTRFTPARDDAGNPVPSVFRGVYTYLIFG